MAEENTVIEDRLICENIIGSVFYSSVKPYLAGQFYSTCRKRGYRPNRDPFFQILTKSLHQIAQIKFENCKVFIASEGAHPLRHPLSKQGRSANCY